MTNTDRKIEDWKNRLLDLSRRNRLLFYKDTKRSSLRIREPSIFDLWDILAVKGKSFEFPYVDDDPPARVSNEEDSARAVVIANGKSGVVTNQSPGERQKTLRNIRDKAKTVKEEQGVNVLYLAFGFLTNRRDVGENDCLLAPIILLPVSLTLKNLKSPFVLEASDDEPVLNPTLAHKLKTELGVDLSPFENDMRLEDYLRQIASLVKDYKWDVVIDESGAGLSCFPFLNINMYDDLEAHKEKIKGHPIIDWFVNGNPPALPGIDYSVAGFDHDSETKPVDLFQVVDADSSQQDAILLAKRGASFILRGPPGTGKSQTITNIIAESIAAGKKVLFVAEKIAALDVVLKRLAEVGLADFCLSLHSHKANKKEVLQQLSSVLDLRGNRTKITNATLQELDFLQEDKEALNQYARQLHAEVLPLGRTIYEANGELARLESYDNVIFDIPEVAGIDSAGLNRRMALLDEFARTIGKMNDDAGSNPWYGASIHSASPVFRFDAEAQKPDLLEKIERMSMACGKTASGLLLNFVHSRNGMRLVLEVLALSAKSPKAPPHWILNNDISALAEEIKECKKAKQRFLDALPEAESAVNSLANDEASFTTSDPAKWSCIAHIDAEIAKVDETVADDECYSVWHNDDFDEVQTQFKRARNNVALISEARSEVLARCERDILDFDYKQILLRFETEYASIFKYFKKQYKEDRRTIRGFALRGGRQFNDNDIVKILKSLKQIQDAKGVLAANESELRRLFGKRYALEKTDFDALKKSLETFAKITEYKEILAQLRKIAWRVEEHDKELKSRFDYLYSGITTDWEKAERSLDWANEFRKLRIKHEDNAEFIRAVCSDDEKIALCAEHHSALSGSVADFEKSFDWFGKLFDASAELDEMPMSALHDKVGKCLGNFAALEEWIDFRNARSACIDAGLSDCVDKIDRLKIKAEYIVPIFKKRFYHLWLAAVLPQYPAVMAFRRNAHEERAGKFRIRDKGQFAIAQKRAYVKLCSALAALNPKDEAVLQRELSKKSRIKPIRKLLGEIPELITTLKPCLMMSPLSVSQYLEGDDYEFDTVIFDEASQVRTENAIGAIFRGRQVIITGDERQLPPTDFFKTLDADDGFDGDDDDASDVSAAYESILHETSVLPSCELLWHYRSRHEHLIAFSNQKIYGGKLVTFPSNHERDEDNGVWYFHVADGIFDRGGKNGNPVEAERVAQLVYDHFARFPTRSLGVVAFGSSQQNAIDTAIRKLRKEDPRFEAFFDESRDEPFFIKNLENVQGDERDTIIFSIGYAKDAAGKFPMFFGPLSREGGERRLNVAITRAKRNVKLVGSIHHTDIDAERINATGPKLLRDYIDFAVRGPKAILGEDTDSGIISHDSPFEEAVYRFLERRNYKLSTRVGCSGYKIDIAVKHPAKNGYAIGIECDGAAYNSARTARERDRLRQDVLEGLGWTFHRVWSTDWIKDSVAEGKKLVDAIESAIGKNDVALGGIH